MAFRSPLSRLLRTARGDGRPGVDIGQAPFTYFGGASLGGFNPDGASVVTLYDSLAARVGEFAALAEYDGEFWIGILNPATGNVDRVGMLSTRAALHGRTSGKENSFNVYADNWPQPAAGSEATLNVSGAAGSAHLKSDLGGSVWATVYAGSENTGSAIIVGLGTTPAETVLIRPQGGTTITGPLTVPAPAWTALTLAGAWAYYGSPWTSPAYSKDAAGRVHVKGTIKGGAVGSVVATLPVGYRPPENHQFATVTGDGATDSWAKVQVLASGDIVASSPLAVMGFYSLDGLDFATT